MNFNKGKDDLNVKDILASSFLSQTHLKTDTSVNLYEVQNDTLAQCSTMSSHKDQVSALFQNFLFTTNSPVEGTEDYAVTVPVSDELQFKQHIFKDSDEGVAENFSGSVTLPLTYYSPVSTNTSDLINIVSKTNQAQFIQEDVGDVACQVGTNELSEEMIRSFVVGGNKLTSQCSNQSVTNDTIQAEDLLSNNKQCIVRVITTDNDKDGENLPGSTPDNSNQQIMIFTDEEEIVCDNDEFSETSNQVVAYEYEEIPSRTVEIPLQQISNNDEGDVSMVNLDQNKSDFSTVGRTKPKCSCLTNGIQSGLPSAEEIMKNYPVLHLSFNVEAEIADYNGIILGREITTQTTPFRVSKSWGSKKTSKTPTTATPELKVILTTDDDFEVKRKRTSEDSQQYRQHKCSRCSLRFMDEYTLDIHMKCHSADVKEKRYKCYLCDFVHSQWIKMYYHLFSHGIKKPFSCSQCNFSCVNKSDLTSHMFVHSETKEWRCLKCNRLFKHRRNMVAHDRTCLGLDDLGNRKKVETPEPCICPVCDKHLSNKRNLEKHMEIHNDIKPYKCKFCKHTTRLKDSLIMHMRLHTGEKPFKCDQCDYSTPDKSSLRRHKRRHTNEKPYRCSFCEYKAIQKHCLDTHIRRKHTGEKFVCAFCNFTTYDRYGLNQHYRQHERGIISSNLNDEDRTCIVNLVGEVTIPENIDKKSANPQAIFLRNPEQTDDDSTKVDKSWDSATTTLTANILKDSLTNVSTMSSSAIPSVMDQSTIEVGEAEASLLQDIQQPGDVVFMQENGNIVIKKPDGTILIIREKNPESESGSVMQT